MSTSLARMLVTIDEQPCPYGCSYCFTKFSQYDRPMNLAMLESSSSLLDNIDVLYPACDVDLFARSDALTVLERVVALGRSISISTKAPLRQSVVSTIAGHAGQMAHTGKILKIGVSFATKYHVPDIEPRTPSYNMRLDALRSLGQEEIPCAAVVKPLLADIPDSEYEEILDDVGGITPYVLLGEEWLDSRPERQRSCIKEPREAIVSKQPVTWIGGKPDWPIRETPDRLDRLNKYAANLGLDVSESDIDLMGKLMPMK